MKDENTSGFSSQAFAYTPGLRVKKETTITKVRKLPLKGKVQVKVGDEVSHDQVVAQAYVQGDPVIVDAASQLEVEPRDLPYYILKKEGEKVQKGEPVARFRAFLGVVDRIVRSSVDGTVEKISDITGQITIRENQIPIEVDAYIPGKVVEVIPNEGAVIETRGAFVQGIFGIGGEAHGELKILGELTDKVITADLISSDCKGKVLVGRSQITLDALNKAVEVGVSGIVVGGVKDRVLMDFLKEEIGVAITGEEKMGLTLIITEGFGEINMSKRTFDILRESEGYAAAVNGATQIRAGVVRPEIIVPHNLKEERESEVGLAGGMVPGTSVRIIRSPHFGVIGKVKSLPIALQEVEAGSLVRVLTVELEDGTDITVPRANVEIIEE
jgi:hypothetical protein